MQWPVVLENRGMGLDLLLRRDALSSDTPAKLLHDLLLGWSVNIEYRSVKKRSLIQTVEPENFAASSSSHRTHSSAPSCCASTL